MLLAKLCSRCRRHACIAVLALPVLLAGCGGGGGAAPPAGRLPPNITSATVYPTAVPVQGGSVTAVAIIDNPLFQPVTQVQVLISTGTGVPTAYTMDRVAGTADKGTYARIFGIPSNFGDGTTSTSSRTLTITIRAYDGVTAGSTRDAGTITQPGGDAPPPGPF